MELPLRSGGDKRQLVQPTLENKLAVSRKVNMHLPFDPAIPGLGIDSKEMKNICPHKDLCAMFTTDFFIYLPKTGNDSNVLRLAPRGTCSVMAEERSVVNRWTTG